MTAEAIQKNRDSHKGIIPSPETLQKRAAALKKTYESPDLRRRISEVQKLIWKRRREKKLELADKLDSALDEALSKIGVVVRK